MNPNVHKKNIRRLIKALKKAEDEVLEVRQKDYHASSFSPDDWEDVFYDATLQTVAIALDELLIHVAVSEKNIGSADSQFYTTKMLLKSLDNIKRSIRIS